LKDSSASHFDGAMHIYAHAAAAMPHVALPPLPVDPATGAAVRFDLAKVTLP
jgi:hypothetical protein